MAATVGIRPASASASTPNVQTTVADVSNWRQAALKLYRKNFTHNQGAKSVHGTFYAGSERPFGTYHVQFGSGNNPTNLSEVFIVNVDR